MSNFCNVVVLVALSLLLLRLECVHLAPGGGGDHEGLEEADESGSELSDDDDDGDIGIRQVLENNPEIVKLIQEEPNNTLTLDLFHDLRKAYTKYFAKYPNDTVKFYLYNDPSNPSEYKEVIPDDEESLKAIKLEDGTTVLKFLVHGFTDDYNGSFAQDTKNAYLQHSKHPVITVDWSRMAGYPEGGQFRGIIEPFLYTGIVDNNIPRVGEYIGKFVGHLIHDNVISSLDQVHLIGHSLGSHVSGEAGETVLADRDGEKIGRITGLDPAGPHFEKKTIERRLDKSDAKFVDIYHTSYLAGDRRPTGHVDFFPNSEAWPQPGCDNNNQTGVPHYVDVALGSCDHHRAVDFYIESISNKNYFGCKFGEPERRLPLSRQRKCSEECDSTIVYGEHIAHTTVGEYCLMLVLERDM